ncbi:LysM peptidoglycan-binding domain-containing protein [Myroides indicus]|uniref:Amino acid/amide ABC transporter substrate-binding protein (HAAT family) n=1 Tax=Myroides indicus TaxID=1323422 RepID=A0A4R7F4T5_9FLAO|nr:LysM peptidoglycan-binding domain-containing protein [Myroides indicus]TDS65067.1 amino acid/amide ABC transporter substrate-binding protein (HAAT family) [Myroides indicus]
MRKKIITICSAFLLTIFNLQAQDSSFIQYRVNKGDTISKIAREYNIPVSELLKYNPEAKSGIKEGSFVLIPTKEFLSQENDKSIDLSQKEIKDNSVSGAKGQTHVVQPKETLYGISKTYNISVEDILVWNPEIRFDGLKAGSTIIVGKDVNVNEPEQIVEKTYLRNLPASAPDTIKNIHNIYYETVSIEPKQTIYGLAVMYNTTIQRLVELNPELRHGLKIGQQIKVPAYGGNTGNDIKVVTPSVDSSQENTGKYSKITVEPQQTVYSISKEYEISIGDLLKLNPDLKAGLKSGMELIVPSKSGNADEDYSAVEINTTGSFVELSKSLNKNESKEIAFLLPFNIEKLGNTPEERLKSDAFLNMTLDFYSGVLLAVEQANKLGLPLRVNVYDSNESKDNSSVETILKQNNFSNTDVIIGPFFKTNVDKAVQNLPNKDIIVVSPLSNERTNPSSQLVQTMPYGDVLKRELLDYFIKQNTKITVIVDDKKASTKRFMQRSYPNIKTISTGLLSDIDKTLVAGKRNVFILDSNSIESALLLTNKLKDRVSDFDIQIASFDKSDIFDYGEINIQTLVDLKYTFPSVTRESGSASETAFAREYKNKNNIYPNRFATRGYDVAYDVILRLFQGKDFVSTLNYKTQEVENKFVYHKNAAGVIQNTGVYLLQYDENLTVKEL